jgi:5S rRNA maturation endonuclease (ribonuclease M5)
MGSTGLHAAIRELIPRYRDASKAERTEILDHLCAVFSIHRKHAIRLLAHPPPRHDLRPGRPRQYDQTTLLPPLLAIWKATNLICSKRLAKCLPLWVPHYRDADGRPLSAAVWGRGERGVLLSLQSIEASVPFKIRGFDCDNGGEFINHNLVKYFLHRKQPVHFTRSRAYNKNDNAHIEEKNWSKVRQYLGYGRFDDPRIVEMLNDLFTKEWALLHNYFLPSVKLLEKRRTGARIVKIHDHAKTPAQRLVDHRETRKEIKRRMKTEVADLNPFLLQQAIKQKITTIMEYVNFTATKS